MRHSFAQDPSLIQLRSLPLSRQVRREVLGPKLVLVQGLGLMRKNHRKKLGQLEVSLLCRDVWLVLLNWIETIYWNQTVGNYIDRYEISYGIRFVPAIGTCPMIGAVWTTGACCVVWKTGEKCVVSCAIWWPVSTEYELTEADYSI